MSSSSSSEPGRGEFVNHGLNRWNRNRAKWLSPPSPDSSKRQILPRSYGEVKARTVDVDDVIERVFGQNSNGVLREPIPLGQMIDILIDFWEADGLYD